MTLPLTESPAVSDDPTGAADAAAHRARRAGKRAFDMAVAAAALVALSPVFLVLALLVRCSSPGPVFFTQTRVGVDGRPFRMVKFRTMRADAERLVVTLTALNEASGPLFKIRRDPRLTRVGRWLRRSSLDELPQLYNVLTGSMSLVGPRPALPHEVAAFDRSAHRRHAVRPGLTGLSQVSGRSDLDWERTIALDLHYVEHCSPSLDLVILARTVLAVVVGRGAY
ncbi:sugar transferase [Nocardioides sp. BP30]|uniref:sugar transferase n=1 Tax=Nocardioides sp. BP30 TaxID=3036374 RepID=UPI002468B77C|nr:sugar transferase [Nocardioides sp. BP30]WGL51012.1 sugar transferase [Nocardioides sp. BP30]